MLTCRGGTLMYVEGKNMDTDASPTLYIEMKTELNRVSITTQYHEVNTHLLHLISLSLSVSVYLSLSVSLRFLAFFCVSVRLCTGASAAIVLD